MKDKRTRNSLTYSLSLYSLIFFIFWSYLQESFHLKHRIIIRNKIKIRPTDKKITKGE